MSIDGTKVICNGHIIVHPLSTADIPKFIASLEQALSDDKRQFLFSEDCKRDMTQGNPYTAFHNHMREFDAITDIGGIHVDNILFIGNNADSTQLAMYIALADTDAVYDEKRLSACYELLKRFATINIEFITDDVSTFCRHITLTDNDTYNEVNVYCETGEIKYDERTRRLLTFT